MGDCSSGWGDWMLVVVLPGCDATFDSGNGGTAQILALKVETFEFHFPSQNGHGEDNEVRRLA